MIFQENTLSDSVAHSIFEGLVDNTTLVYLNLSDTRIAVSRSLTKMFQVNKSLTRLDLSQNTLSDLVAHSIFEGLVDNTTLVYLNLSDTRIVVSRSLTKMFQVNKSLAHLDLSQNTLSDLVAHSIFEGLVDNTTLVNLNLSDTGVSATAMSFTKMLQVNKSLTHLDLSNNSTAFSDSGSCCIFESLQHNNTILNLNLSGTGITATDPDTARSLTKMLQVNKSLKHLDLSYNAVFSDSGACCFFESLHYNTTLVNLNLSQTGNADYARSLKEMLQVNKTLTYLDLSNYFTQRITHLWIISCVFEGLEHNITLRYLDLHVASSSKVYVDEDFVVENITRALKTNQSLQTLNIAGWLFHSHNGIDLILESLMFNSTLQTLYINNIGLKALSTFKRARATKSLPPIDVHTNITE